MDPGLRSSSQPVLESAVRVAELALKLGPIASWLIRSIPGSRAVTAKGGDRVQAAPLDLDTPTLGRTGRVLRLPRLLVTQQRIQQRLPVRPAEAPHAPQHGCKLALSRPSSSSRSGGHVGRGGFLCSLTAPLLLLLLLRV